VEYTIHVPHSAHIEHIGTVNGTLRIVGVETVEDLHTVNGNIEVLEAGGSVHAHTTNGNVHLELAHLREKNAASAETTNGSVVLALPSSAQADLEARCLNGNFYSELPSRWRVLRSPVKSMASWVAEGSNPPADHQRRHSSGCPAVNGLGFATSKDSGGWDDNE